MPAGAVVVSEKVPDVIVRVAGDARRVAAQIPSA
jgi:hypothetical protein